MSWLTAVPWIIAAAGWVVAHLLNEARERRKEFRALLDKIYDRLSKLERDAREFHMATAFMPRNSLDITSQIDAVERILHRIPVLQVDDLTSELIALRRSITLENFDSSTFVTQGETSEVLAEISDSVATLEERIEAQYENLYPHSFPFFKLKRRKNISCRSAIK